MGKMHGFMRMYWGKKVQAAVHSWILICVALHDVLAYALKGVCC